VVRDEFRRSICGPASASIELDADRVAEIGANGLVIWCRPGRKLSSPDDGIEIVRLNRPYRRNALDSAALGTLVLSGFGVYLGRFLRWNSWDIVHRPHLLLRDIAGRVLDPVQHAQTWGFTLGFGTLLIFGYLFWISSAHAHPKRD
jgi:hypothetical protein